MPPRADRSTSASASTGTSTSGGASSCATKGEETPPRRAVSLAGLPAVRHEHRGYASLPDDERDRQSKRNFYRIIDRFGWRRDLLVSTLTAAAVASRSSWCCQTVSSGSRRPMSEPGDRRGQQGAGCRY